jgi:hypothetical protein
MPSLLSDKGFGFADLSIPSPGNTDAKDDMGEQLSLPRELNEAERC